MTMWIGSNGKTVFTPFPYNRSRRGNYRKYFDPIMGHWRRFPVSRNQLIMRTIDKMMR